MRYRVVFAKRFQPDGNESPIDPTVELDTYLGDGVVAEKLFVERLEPAAQHSQEVLDEDDDFLASATPETWEYDVVDSRIDEFIDAMRNSKVVLNFAVIDESETTPEEAAGQVLDTPAPPSEGSDDLTVVNANSKDLGLTRPGDPGADWAANTGPAREADISTPDIRKRRRVNR